MSTTIYLIGDGTVIRHSPNILDKVAQWRFPGRFRPLRRDFTIPHTGGEYYSADHNACTRTGLHCAGFKPYRACWSPLKCSTKLGLWTLIS